MNYKRNIWYLLLVSLVFGLLFAACGGSAPTEAPAAEEPAAGEEEASAPEPAAEESQKLQEITFQAGFIPQGNISFVAAYIAKEKGYFEEVGLDVTIEHAAPGTGEQWTRLAGKDIEFTTDPAESFVKRVDTADDLPFISVAVFGHEGDHALMVLEDSGITEIGQLEGKLVGYKGTGEPPWLLAMLDSEGLTLDDVQIVQVGFDPRVLLPEFGEGRVDAVQVFKSNEPDILSRQGYNVRLFNPEDFGVHFMGQTYVTHTDFIRDDPEMVRNFVRATMKGLAFALDPANKEEVTDIIMVYAGEDADRVHNEFIWQTEIQFVQSASTEQVGLGYTTDEQWQNMMDVMVSFGAIEEPLPVDTVWDSQFVESIYENGELIWPE